MIGQTPVYPAYQAAALSTDLGLIEPGKCQKCGNHGPRWKFYNEFADPPVEMDLCMYCMSTAVRCVGLYLLNTPTGKEALEDWKYAQQDYLHDTADFQEEEANDNERPE